jgi:hypothetical protein
MARLESRCGEKQLLDFLGRVEEKPPIWCVVFLFQSFIEAIDIVAEDNGTT